ncbi:MAG: ubiquinol-cytochrome c reductase iron-sulfur subunit [Frankiaceae bacterium]|jgi:ubiquinol-cytochrome c reductase iron-sulfur subunit|nr:ubiquinol-cytochrome c reductase iron-sulfur subunit [Frankiaceae bacterium]
MSDEDKDAPRTAAEASGSVFERGKSPQKRTGEPRTTGGTSSAKEIEGEVLAGGSMGADVPAKMRTARKIGRRKPLTETAAAAQEAMFTRPSDEDGTHAVPAEAFGLEHDPAQVDPREEKFAELQVSALFGLAALGVIGFVLGFVLMDFHRALGRDLNFVIGGSFTVSLLGLGAGLVLWAKKLLPHDKAVQERHDFHSPEEEELAAEDVFLKGATEMGLGSRKMLRRSLLGAAALLPIPAVLMLRDLGPLPGRSLRHTGWKPGIRLVDVETKLPIKLGDIEIGGIATVMPDGFDTTEHYALAPTILIRFAPGEIRSKKEASWGINDHVAYSKICSHAGCPISLYEQQTHHLLCPCHQSTFDMADDANVIFGPAARRLPQLAIEVDPEGYFVAQKGYTEPVGPSFWERG